MIFEKKNGEVQDQELSTEETPPIKKKVRPKTKWGPKKTDYVKYCSKCKDTSFVTIPDGNCYRCGKEF